MSTNNTNKKVSKVQSKHKLDRNKHWKKVLLHKDCVMGYPLSPRGRLPKISIRDLQMDRCISNPISI